MTKAIQGAGKLPALWWYHPQSVMLCVFLPGCRKPGWIIASVTFNLKIWSVCTETMCYWLQETPACPLALPRICLSNNGGSEAEILGFSVVNNECCTSCRQTLKPSVLRCSRERQRERETQPNMHLSGPSSLNSSLQISKKVTLPFFFWLALCILSQNTTTGPRFWPGIKSSIFLWPGNSHISTP